MLNRFDALVSRSPALSRLIDLLATWLLPRRPALAFSNCPENGAACWFYAGPDGSGCGGSVYYFTFDASVCGNTQAYRCWCTTCDLSQGFCW